MVKTGMRSRFPEPLAADTDEQTSVDRARRRVGGALPKFYTVEQVASLLEVSDRTVRRWIGAGLLAQHRFGKRSVRIAESAATCAETAL